MSMAKGRFGKDHPERFLDGALDGDIHGDGGRQFQDSMTSNEMSEKGIGKSQKILTAVGLDNVGRVYDRYESSMKDTHGIGGGPENLSHSLTGCSAVQTKVT